MKAKCEICGKKAKKRIRYPVTLYLCRECARELMTEIEKKGMKVAECPAGTPQVKMHATDIDYQAAGCSLCITWIARTKEEYERGMELGMIAGWASWEQYEAHFANLCQYMHTPLVQLEISPDDIIEALEELGLPNTPEGRQRLYPILWQRKKGCEA